MCGNLAAQTRGQWFAFILSLCIIGVGAWLIYVEKTTQGVITILSDLVLMLGLYFYGKETQRRERAARREELEGAKGGR